MSANIKQTQNRKIKQQSICFLDTEFNAKNYNEQNDGYQEITEIGAVYMENGIVIDRFSTYCKIKKGHKLTKRCKNITGITPEILNEKGMPFNQAMKNFKEFIDKHKISKIYTFGNADAEEMLATAKLNNSGPEVYELIKKIHNIYPQFQNKLDLHYVFSLSDICKICNVNHNVAHSALADAEDTGYAYLNMKAGNINTEILNEINIHKYNVGIYRDNRSLKMVNIKHPEVVTQQFIHDIESVFDNAKDMVKEPILIAIHDDMMRLIGRPDLEIGEDNL